MRDVNDILLDKDFDLLFADGDIVTGDSVNQHQQCLLIAEPGEYKYDPGVGVGVYSYLNDDETNEAIKKAIQRNFEADGMTIKYLALDAKGNVDVLAEYK